jgi:hypothetical protein
LLKELENNPKIKEFFTDLLKKYSEKFSQDKKINISSLPLQFEGFHSGRQTGNNYEEMGNFFIEKFIYPTEGKIANIGLNRVYLLNKFGFDKYFPSSPQESGDYNYVGVSFSKMLNTCSHELAHYFQLVKHGKSSCESELISESGKYDRELAREQEE